LTVKTQIGRSNIISYTENAPTDLQAIRLATQRPRFNIMHMWRVFFTCMAIWLLSWYSMEGISPWGERSIIRVYGDGGGYSVACIAVKFGGDTAAISSFRVTGALPGAAGLPEPEFSGTAVWKTVYPFADSAEAVLLTFQMAKVLICDSSVFIPRTNGPHPQFWEKLDLIVIPAADEKAITGVRAAFRPRMMAAIPPCSAPSGQNIACSNVSQGGAFSYNFLIKGVKLKFANGY